jgi:hypothetical protein
MGLWNKECERLLPGACMPIDEMCRGYDITVLIIIVPATESPDEKPFASDRRLISKSNYAMNRLAVHRTFLDGWRGM